MLLPTFARAQPVPWLHGDDGCGEIVAGSWRKLGEPRPYVVLSVVARPDGSALYLGRGAADNVLELVDRNQATVWQRRGPVDGNQLDWQTLRGDFREVTTDAENFYITGVEHRGQVCQIDIANGACIPVSDFGAYRGDRVWVSGGAVFRVEAVDANQRNWIRHPLDGTPPRLVPLPPALTPTMARAKLALRDGGAVFATHGVLTAMSAMGEVVGQLPLSQLARPATTAPTFAIDQLVVGDESFFMLCGDSAGVFVVHIRTQAFSSRAVTTE